MAFAVHSHVKPATFGYPLRDTEVATLQGEAA